MSDCKWTILENGRLWCPECDPDKTRTQRRDTRRWCGPMPKFPEPPVEAVVPGGVGYHLKRLLARILLLGRAGCGCNAHAAEMDRNGPDWCEANIDTIVGWMRAEAKRRKLPFSVRGARLLVRVAIRNARRDLPA